MKIRKNDEVIVIAGKYKGKTGKVLEILSKKDRIIVEQINVVKKHLKASEGNPTGKIDEVEASIHVSNVMLLDTKVNKPTRVRIQVGNDGVKSRVSVKSGVVI
ncbi:MAG: 50S ribosomal protein L24 [Deltaproteobacteria bacterium]|nr:50S ribosomal protein L24 [Deltaproteobacteria bacterium]